MALTTDQIKFIEGRVQSMKSVEAVSRFYNKKDKVSEFALKYANEFFGGGQWKGPGNEKESPKRKRRIQAENESQSRRRRVQE